MLYDQTRGAGSPIMVEKDGHRGDPMMVLAVMIILVIFIFVIFAIFALKRDHKRDGGGIAEIAGAALAAGAINKPQHHPEMAYGAYNYQMAHDNMRDNLREFGEIKKEIALTHASTDAKTAQYFYQTQREIEQAKFDNYKATKESEEKVLMAIKDSEIKASDRAYAREREDNLYHRIAATYHHAQRPPMFSNVFASNEQVAAGY